MTYGKTVLLLTALLCGCLAEQSDNTPMLTVKDICYLMPPGNIILQPNSCSNWVRCPTSPEANDYEEGSCVHGLYFDKNTGRCRYQDEVQCPYKDEPRQRCTGKNDGAYLPDGETCNGYIFCKDGRESHSTCPNDLVFNPHSAGCVYKEDYECPISGESIEMSPHCRSIGDNIAFAHETDCVKYNICVEGNLETKECDLRMAFDHLRGQCVAIEKDLVCLPSAKAPEPESTVCVGKEGYIPDGESCSGYYICAQIKNEREYDRHPLHMQCSNGFFFDAEKWSCRDRLRVKCTLDRCEGMGNKYVNIAGDCTAYARCKDNAQELTGNCPANHFFDERTQGCTPQVINYEACMP